jgi:hypothetical protein
MPLNAAGMPSRASHRHQVTEGLHIHRCIYDHAQYLAIRDGQLCLLTQCKDTRCFGTGRLLLLLIARSSPSLIECMLQGALSKAMLLNEAAYLANRCLFELHPAHWLVHGTGPADGGHNASKRLFSIHGMHRISHVSLDACTWQGKHNYHTTPRCNLRPREVQAPQM